MNKSICIKWSCLEKFADAFSSINNLDTYIYLYWKRGLDGLMVEIRWANIDTQNEATSQSKKKGRQRCHLKKWNTKKREIVNKCQAPFATRLKHISTVNINITQRRARAYSHQIRTKFFWWMATNIMHNLFWKTVTFAWCAFLFRLNWLQAKMGK